MSIATDDQGLPPNAFTPELAAGTRFFHMIPNFQNLTGRRLPPDCRQALVVRAKELGVLLVEDDPYGELSYTSDASPSLHSLNPDGVVYMGSFPKILASGMCLSYIIAPEHIHLKLIQVKQASDLHMPSFTQRVAYEVLRTGLLNTHIPNIRSLYGKQCEAILDLLTCHVPAGVHWNCPGGGMFIWAEVSEGIDMMALLEKAVTRDVAFVSGVPFYANAPYRNTLRLAFVTVTPERIEQGIVVLSELMRAEIAALTLKVT